MKLLNRKNKGFTLTELIIVIVIIGILAGVLIPSLTGYVQKARISAAEQEANAIYEIYKNYNTEVEAGSFTKTEKPFTTYYLEIAGVELQLQSGNVEELGWSDETGTGVTTSGKTVAYNYSFAHENGYTVLLDADGNSLGAMKR